MNRLAVGIEYDGSAFAGWQMQQSAPSIQSLVEGALRQVAAEPINVVCAGRTDAGVHARWQVAHFETHAHRSLRGWILGANSQLPPEVSLVWVRPVPAHFHARYSAESRTYRYFILNRATRSALASRRATWIYRPLDHQLMAEATPVLCGEHDFSAFRSSECQAHSPIRRLERLSVTRQGEWITIEATANAFLHHMMRNIVGLLIAIGRGEQPPSWSREVLEGRDRRLSAPTARPDGLYLWAVRYPEAFGLPDPPADNVAAGRSAMIATQS
jgi:tRNA pseudouridine38-40 synthase